MNLLQLLLGSLTTDDSINSVSKKTGVSSKTISKLLMIAVPLLISYMTKNASKKDGAQSLLSALTQHTSSATVSSQIKNADSDDGAKIIAHILGKDQNAIVNNLAAQANISTAQVNSVLNNIAPAILNSLSTAASATAAKPKPASPKVDLSDGIDLSDIAGLLGGATASNTNANPAAGLLGSLLGGSSNNNASGQMLNMLGSVLGGTSQQQTQQSASSIDGSQLLGLLTSLMK